MIVGLSHYCILARDVRDNNPLNQAFADYQGDYDNLQTDLLILRDRAVYTGAKGEIVRQQINNANNLFYGVYKTVSTRFCGPARGWQARLAR